MFWVYVELGMIGLGLGVGIGLALAGVSAEVSIGVGIGLAIMDLVRMAIHYLGWPEGNGTPYIDPKSPIYDPYNPRYP